MDINKFLLILLLELVKADTISVQMKDGTNVGFNITGKVGDGTFGVVYKGDYKCLPGGEIVEVAFKISRGPEGEKHIANEIRIYEHLSSMPNSDPSKQSVTNGEIPLLYGSGTLTACNFGTILSEIELVGQSVLILELAGTELFKAIKDNGTPISRYNFLKIGVNMVKVIQFLHSRGVVHGDIKLENFILRDYDSLELCVVDFGGAQLKNGETGTMAVSWYYCSYSVTMRMLELGGYLPEEYKKQMEFVPKNFDENDDLESLAISFSYTLINGSWADAVKTYSIHEKIHKLKNDIWKQPIHLQEEAWQRANLNEQEINVVTQSMEVRIKTMQTAAGDILKFKESFPEDIPGLSVKAKLPSGSGELIRDVLVFSRRKFPKYQNVNADWMSVSDFEESIIMRLENILELYDVSNVTAQEASSVSNTPKIQQLEHAEVPKKTEKKQRRGFLSLFSCTRSQITT